MSELVPLLKDVADYGFTLFVAVWLLWERLRFNAKLYGVLSRIERKLE